jgi:NAD-dependent deacetylase
MEMTDSAAVLDADLVELLRQARRVVALSGAGISAESGVPTFREAQRGLWAQYDPAELATPEGFARNPQRVWDWYVMRRQLIAQVEPNAGHRALAAWAQRRPGLVVVTQNVDGLHQRAGSDAVIELHGNILRTRCSAEGVLVDEWREVPGEVPRCGQCAAYLRPDVVWFGEMLPPNAFARAERAVAAADLVLSIGTSSLVQPAAQLPYRALQAGIPVVEINPEATPLTPAASFSLRGAAGQILPALLAAVDN